MARVGLLFPGQGAQQIGMGAGVHTESHAARELFDRADNALGWSVSNLCFHGPEEALRATASQQPAILACALALYAAWRERGSVEVACSTGHSLGLYAALIAAGALQFEDGIRLVARRGSLMQMAADERQGSMSAVLGLDVDVVQEVCLRVQSEESPVVAANMNAPDQTVISGAVSAVERAGVELLERGARKIVPLPVAGAFHSPLMASASRGLAVELVGVRIRRPTFPVISSTSAKSLTTPEAIRAELAAQVILPVEWVRTVHACVEVGVERFVDCGPGSTVASLAKRILGSAWAERIEAVDERAKVGKGG